MTRSEMFSAATLLVSLLSLAGCAAHVPRAVPMQLAVEESPRTQTVTPRGFELNAPGAPQRIVLHTFNPPPPSDAKAKTKGPTPAVPNGLPGK